MWGLSKHKKSLAAAGLALLLTACAHTGGPDAQPDNDPLEPFNRKMFAFNENVDRVVLKPVAKGYRAVVPAQVRGGVGNFFLNLGEPTTIVNDLLQGKFNQAAHDFMRFTINSTFGLLGLLDIATPAGMERHDEDFGQTFSVWGIGKGPYLVLPIWGPSTVTDGIGLIPEFFYLDPRLALDDSEAYWGSVALNVVDVRARALGASKVMELQLDPYVFRRETYFQQRRSLVHDGAPPLEEDWEE